MVDRHAVAQAGVETSGANPVLVSYRNLLGLRTKIRASRLTARIKAPFSSRVSTTRAALFYGGWLIDNAANKSFLTGRRRRNGG
jgi:hypothetical protein